MPWGAHLVIVGRHATEKQHAICAYQHSWWVEETISSYYFFFHDRFDDRIVHPECRSTSVR